MDHQTNQDELSKKIHDLNNVSSEILKIICKNIKLKNKDYCAALMDFYKKLYYLIRTDMTILPQMIYDKFCAIVHKFITIKIIPKFKLNFELSDIANYWEIFKNDQKIIGFIFSEYDRYKRKTYSGDEIYYRVPIIHRSQIIFKNLLTENKLLIKISNFILSKIDDMRNDSVNIKLMQLDVISAIQIFIEINIVNILPIDKLVNDSSYKNISLLQYKKYIEEPYIKGVYVRYRSIIDAMYNLSCEKYHLQISEFVKIEHKLINIFLSKSSKNYLIQTIYEILIHDGIKYLHDNNNFDDLVQSDEKSLKFIYTLYNEADKLELNKIISATFMTELNNAVNKKKCQELKHVINGKYIANIIKVKHKYDNMLKIHFEKNNSLSISLDNSLIEFINNIDNISYVLAQYSNIIINRNKGKGFDGILMIFKCLENKDYYENYYTTKLENRLIFKFDRELEHDLLRKLKLIGDFSWCRKIEKMIWDVEQSIKLNSEYKEYRKNEIKAQSSNIKINEFIICTGGTWSKIKQDDYISKLVTSDIDNITQFYMSKFNNKKITWHLQKSLFTVKVLFENVNKLVDVNYNQLIVLELLAGKSLITVNDVLNKMNCKILDIKTDLLALVRLKVGLLQKKPNSINLLKTDKLRFNKRFPKYNLTYRVNIPVLKLKCDLKQEIKTNSHIVRKQRNIIIDSCLTRIMKSRKTIKYNELVSMLYSAVHNKFIPDMQHVKKRISHLIYVEIIVRNFDDRTMLIYVP